MKATELRIGNLVDTSGEFGSWSETIKVNAGSFGITAGGKLLCESYLPIPLTEEWLIKFGFEKEEFKDYSGAEFKTPISLSWDKKPLSYLIIEDFIYVATGEYFRGFIFPHCEKDYFMTGKFTEIQYVHQLQNLYFALTGEELIISK